MEIYVPSFKFEEMFKHTQCANIIDGFVSKTIFYQKKEYVITGGCSAWVWANEVIDIENYSGELVPLSYSDHNRKVDNGTRQRGYEGQKTRHGDRTIVFLKQLVFMPTTVGQQQELF